MPVAIIDYQRRLTTVGVIRAGAEKPERGAGRKLDAWRLTSPRRDLMEQAALLYGGAVTPWQGPNGSEWQVYTEAPELPIYLMPNLPQSLSQRYELWEGATKNTRRCMGDDHVEEISGRPCLCQTEGVDRCSLMTRLIVVLPELDTMFGFKLTSTGATAAGELPTTFDLVRAIAPGRAFVAARLRIDQRRTVIDGQVARFVVPTIDLGVGYLALAGGASDSVVAAAPVSGLASGEASPDGAVESQGSTVPALPAADAIEFGSGRVDDDGGHVPSENPPPPARSQEEGSEPDARKPTQAQTKAMNALVGQLSKHDPNFKVKLWKAVAEKLRGERAEKMIEMLGGADHDGVIHWSPLRASLTRSEASKLLDWLSAAQARNEAADAGSAAQSPTSEPDPELAGAALLPFNQFPEGY